MKTTNLLLSAVVLLLLTAGSLNADDTRYIESMQKNIQSVYKAKSVTDLQGSVNSLERIAAAESDSEKDSLKKEQASYEAKKPWREVNGGAVNKPDEKKPETKK